MTFFPVAPFPTRASNFEPEELPAVMTYLHDRGVRGYIAFNILVFDEVRLSLDMHGHERADLSVGAWGWARGPHATSQACPVHLRPGRDKRHINMQTVDLLPSDTG